MTHSLIDIHTPTDMHHMLDFGSGLFGQRLIGQDAFSAAYFSDYCVCA